MPRLSSRSCQFKRQTYKKSTGVIHMNIINQEQKDLINQIANNLDDLADDFLIDFTDFKYQNPDTDVSTKENQLRKATSQLQLAAIIIRKAIIGLNIELPE
jgi:hypothetical protein